MVINPYRDPSVGREERESEDCATDVEDLVVHGVLVLIGAVGVLVGASHSRSTELVLGGLIAFFAVRRLVPLFRDRWVRRSLRGGPLPRKVI